MINRKQFLTGAAATAAALLTNPWSYGDDLLSPNVIVTIDPLTPMWGVSLSVTGLSYEASTLGSADFFSPQNQGLIALFRRLSDQGVLRLGGNSVEFTDWTPGSLTAPQLAPRALTTKVGHRIRRRTAITQNTIDNLAQFLDATGWNLIYGLNLGTGTPEDAADEAKYVVKALGGRLIALQIGNEPDIYHTSGLRTTDWAYPDYFEEWTRFADAVQKENPGAPLAGPDVASKQSWITQFAAEAKDRVVLLSSHYYAEGPPTSPLATIDALLHHTARLDKYIAAESAAIAETGLPFRMTECNSCYNGGKADVSDTFASSLWGANYVLQLAQAGISGVNFHGGGFGSYTPIAGSIEKGFTARPLFYGMMLAQQFAGTSLLKVQSSDPNVTAYAAHSKQQMLVAVFNLDSSSPNTVQLSTGTHASSAKLWPLTAPTIDSKNGVTFAGAEVGPNGAWSPTASSVNAASPGQFQIVLPAGSAALLFV